MRPQLSVITICFNNPEELKQTCDSVDSQSVLPDEHLVIDGSTSDEIVKWLSQNKQPAYRRWIHERDKGIADAFNKGILNAKGNLLQMLNSGDRYATANAIETVMTAFEANDTLMWTHSLYIQQRGGTDVISGSPFDENQLWKGMRNVAHPSMFVRKEVYDRLGLFNTDYKFSMDYDMLVRMRKEKFSFIATPLVYFAPGGASHIQFHKGLAEVKKSYRSHIGNSFRQSLWQLRQKALHYFMQTPVGRAWFRQRNKKNITSIQNNPQ